MCGGHTKKHLVFRQSLDQTFLVQAKIPSHKPLSKMANDKVFCMQKTVLSKSGSREIWHKLFAFNRSRECAMLTSDNIFHIYIYMKHIHIDIYITYHLSRSQK